MNFKMVIECRYLFVVLSCLLAGCSGVEGPPRAPVSGTVSLDDTPLKEGVVRFVPSEGTEGPKTTVPVADGQFAVDERSGPIVGKHRIEIESTDTGGYAMDDENAIQELRESGTKRIEVVKVPPRYNSRSTLTEEVTADGPNQYKFDLVSRQRR